MSFELGSFGRAFVPRMVNRAVHTFDKATIVIVSSCWGGAILIMLFALYTINMSIVAKRQVIEAAAAEPSLPQLVSRPPELSELKPIVDRLQKRFPEISFSLGNDRALTVSAQQGAKFRTWLTVLSYIDTISPQYRWQIREFCVGGKCSSSIPMKAVLVAQKISFSSRSVRID
ncbi:MAG: hypothetical protein PHD48_10590 [Alphaproteobacteria bacterium]|nr:hypothetical protein [Alphaproteobacteria bacterium]